MRCYEPAWNLVARVPKLGTFGLSLRGLPYSRGRANLSKPERSFFVQRSNHKPQSIPEVADDKTVNPVTRTGVGTQSKAHPPFATEKALNLDEGKVTPALRTEPATALKSEKAGHEVKRVCHVHPNKIGKELLNAFWGEFGGKHNNGIGYSEDQKLIRLLELASVKLPYKRQQSISTRREKFNSGRMRRLRLKHGTLCFVCQSLALHRHHIIQLQNGGINARRNVVGLCAKCHSDIHPWMKK